MGPLYQNFAEFMTKLLEVANDLQLLYVESDEDDTQIVTGNLVLDLLTWLSSFSVCKIRCFRYISTLTLYLFQDYLTQQAVNLEKNYWRSYPSSYHQKRRKKGPITRLQKSQRALSPKLKAAKSLLIALSITSSNYVLCIGIRTCLI